MVSQEDEADDYHEQEVEDEEDLPIEDVQDVQLIEEITDKQPHTQHRRAPTAGHIHPSRLDHVPNTEPYFNPEEWEPVVRSNGSAASVKALHNALKPSEALLAVPEPPPVEQAIPQEQALLDTRSSQEALEKALQAWYTAGYAAALYHVRSGAVKP